MQMLSQIQETCSTLYHTGSPLHHIWKVKDATCTGTAGKVGLSHIRTRVKCASIRCLKAKQLRKISWMNPMKIHLWHTCTPNACTYFA